MVPHAALLQPAPATLQVTDVFELPVTVAANCCLVPSATVAVFGLIFTATVPAGFAGPLEGLLLLVKPTHPERERIPHSTPSRTSPGVCACRGRLAVDIWLRLLRKLRAEMQHALLHTVNTGARRPIQLTMRPERGNWPSPVPRCPKCLMGRGKEQR
jgi:hypothetical protein